MTYISWFSDFAFEDYLMYKHDTLFFYPFIFIWFFLSSLHYIDTAAHVW